MSGNSLGEKEVVITGIGMVSALGNDPAQALRQIQAGQIAAVSPDFDTAGLGCNIYAPATGFDPEVYFPDNKSLRLMNRDALMAVAAAHLAMADAGLVSDQNCPADEIALYGSTGVAGMSVEEIARIIQFSAREDGSLDLGSFGKVALKRIRPVLSFRILANMPICFVSIFQNIKGPNAVFTPWEGSGVQAIISGIQDIKSGLAKCALVGGCDCKTRELSFVNLAQMGLFDSWKSHEQGSIPGEGAVFLVLEEQEFARQRGRKAYARIKNSKLCSSTELYPDVDIMQSVLAGLASDTVTEIVSAADGQPEISDNEIQALTHAGLAGIKSIRPKLHVGNIYAGAAALQVAMAVLLAKDKQPGQQVLANCFGYGTEQGAFLLEAI